MGQLVEIADPTVHYTYTYPAGANNGKISSQDNVNTGEVVSFTYDTLDRLTAASSNQNWGTAYVYDGFGNLLQKNVTAGSAPSLVQSVNTATNQIDYVNYDANGNQTTLNGTPAAYDAQNRMIQYNGWNHYAYNASNQRVWRLWAQCCTSSGQQTTSEEFYVYGVNGQRVATYQIQFELNTDGNHTYVNATMTDSAVYFAGRLVAHGANAVSTDQVGSVIDEWNPTYGTNVFQQYYPWGEEKFGSSPNDRVKFATYRRDSESLLDYAWNRYYSNTLGRFLTPDPYKGSADPYNPQSWNRYGYGLNDPVDDNDPQGSEAGSPGLDQVTICDDSYGADCPGFAPSSGGSDTGGIGEEFFWFWYQTDPLLVSAPSAAASVRPDCWALTAAVGFAGLTYGNALQVWNWGGLADYSTDATAAIIGAMAAVTWQQESHFAYYPINNGNYRNVALTSTDYGPFQINGKSHPDAPLSVTGTNGAGQQFNGNPALNVAYGIGFLELLYGNYGNDAPGRYNGSLGLDKYGQLTSGQIRENIWNKWASRLTSLFDNTQCFFHF